MGLFIQRKAERAGRTEGAQSNSEAERKIPNKEQLQDIDDQ